MAIVQVNGSASTFTITSNVANGVASTFTYNCPAGTTCLVICEANEATPSGHNTVTTFTYNGIPLTQVPGSSVTGGVVQECSINYLPNPPTGSNTISISLGPNTTGELQLLVVPLKGGGTVPGIAKTATGTGTTPAVTVSGASANDLYIGIAEAPVTTMTKVPASQTTLAQQVCRASTIASVDDIAGTNAGAFSWTITSTSWVASAVNFIATPDADTLIAASTTDLVAHNANWLYANLASTNFIQCGTNGAFCNNQSGANFVLASWQGDQFTADQSSQVQIASFVSGAQGGVCVRCSNGAVGPNAYIALFDAAHYNVGRLSNGSFTSLTGGQQARSSNPGDVILLQVQGSTITLFVNGVSLTQVTDSTFASGAPGLAFSGVHPSTVVNSWQGTSLGIIVQPQSSTSVIGQLGGQVSYSPTHQTASFTAGTLSASLSVNLGSFTLTFAEGQLIDFLTLAGQTATFIEGSITSALSGGATFNLSSQSIGGTVGILADEIDYILDQNAVLVIGQTLTSTEGIISFAPTYPFPAYTISDTEGVLTYSTTLGLTAQNITSSEGVIVATTGTTTSIQLLAQNIVSLEGQIAETVSPALTAQTLTSTEGNLTFSNTGNFVVQITGITSNAIEGIIGSTFTPGSGYPNLAGLLLEEATERLELAGAVVPASIGYFGTWPISAIWVPSQAPPFVVLAQSVTPGAPVIPNAPITLTVSQPSESVAYP